MSTPWDDLVHHARTVNLAYITAVDRHKVLAMGDEIERLRTANEDLAAAAKNLLADIVRVEDELDRLRTAIREHRDQRGDDRCWLDDQRLYHALGEGDPDPFDPVSALPPKADFLASCERFWIKRQCPGQEGRALLPDEMTIAELTAEVRRLREHRDRVLIEWKALKDSHDGIAAERDRLRTAARLALEWFDAFEHDSVPDTEPLNDLRAALAAEEGGRP